MPSLQIAVSSNPKRGVGYNDTALKGLLLDTLVKYLLSTLCKTSAVHNGLFEPPNIKINVTFSGR